MQVESKEFQLPLHRYENQAVVFLHYDLHFIQGITRSSKRHKRTVTKWQEEELEGCVIFTNYIILDSS